MSKTLTVKTANIKGDDGQSAYVARIYLSGKFMSEATLRGNGYSSASAYKQSIRSLSGKISGLIEEGMTLKIEAHLNREVGRFESSNILRVVEV